MTLLVTGGAGFIGSNFVLDWFKRGNEKIINLDLLTYAGNLQNLDSLKNDDRHVFVQGDIGDETLLTKLLSQYKPRAIINFAAESHVDRSIAAPDAFIQTNIVGTFRLLESVRRHWQALPNAEQNAFRFLHVSTDEVYGTLAANEPAFTEEHPCQPNSPYSASKAASDHLVRSYFHTYRLPVLTTNCSNNYGPYHFPEKLIPLVIHNALAGKPLPIYGDGQQIRDWLYVTDHCAAIRTVLVDGVPGETYNVGGWNEKPNIEIVNTICELLEELAPDNLNSRTSSLRLRADRSNPSDSPDKMAIVHEVRKGHPEGFKRLITYVKDRPGHDRRYAIDARKIERELSWKPQETFETGIRKTIEWYLANQAWVDNVTSGQYRDWVSAQYS